MTWLAFYLLCFLGAFALGTPLAWLSRAAGLRMRAMDEPGGRKAHKRAVPVTGGWGVFATFAILSACGGLLAPPLAAEVGGLSASAAGSVAPYLENIVGVRFELAMILLGCGFIFAVGAIDDLRPLPPLVKLAAQFLSVVPLLAGGVTIHGFLPHPALGWIATALWIVTLMNAFNFMDNTDGLCASVGATVAAVLALAAVLGGERLLPAMFLTLSGALAGFLVFNRHPASIFLGDSGSLTTGYLLGVFSVLTTWYQPGQSTGLPVLIPLAVMGVPLFDMASVLLIRWRAGAPFMVGDRNHFAHRLQAMGFSVPQTTATISLLTGASGLLSLALRHLGPAEAALHLIALAMLFGVVAALEFIGRTSPRG